MSQPTGRGNTGQGNGPDSGSGSRLGTRLRQVFISGLAISIPVIVTVLILTFVVNFVRGLVGPAAAVATDIAGVGQSVPDYALEAIAVGVVVGAIFLVGVVAESRFGGGLESAFDRGMSAIPGFGSVYTSFNEMSELLLSSDSQSFREVKLVEFPTQGSYTVAFVTADAPREVEEATGSGEMTTLFMPMAPNPVMGGFVLHVDDDRVYDIDVSVEEGIQSIVTSGVTVGADEEVSSGVGEIEPVEAPDELVERIESGDDERSSSP